MHGKQSEVELDTESQIFSGMNKNQSGQISFAGIKGDTLPEELKVIAQTEDGEVMAVEHNLCPVYGVQFHPNLF